MTLLVSLAHWKPEIFQKRDAGAEPNLAVSPQSKLWPALRHLTLYEFALLDGDARVFEDFCSFSFCSKMTLYLLFSDFQSSQTNAVYT